MSASEPAVRPNAETMLDHLSWIVGPALSAYPDLKFEIAWGPPARGPAFAKTLRLDQINAAVAFAAWINARGCNVYVGATLKRADTPAKGRTRSDHATVATCLPVDIDGGFVTGARKLAVIAKPRLVVITGHAPELRGQLWIRLTPTENMDIWSEVNRRSVIFCGGDRFALGTYRLMRLAGTVSFPSSQKQARGYGVEMTFTRFVDAPTYELRDLLNRLPAVGPRHELMRSNEGSSTASAKSVLPSNLRGSPPLNRTNVAIVKSMLNALPDDYAGDFGLWLRVGFALHEFDGGPSGLALWRQFSERCPEKARQTDFDRRWVGFDREFAGRRLSLGWLWIEAQTHGWSTPRRWDRSTKIAS